jgi:hypothetical protein
MVAAATSKKGQKIATPKEVRQAIVKMPESYLRCRDLGHTWLQYRVKRIRGGFERSLFCRSCKTNKHMFISPKGEILASNYVYHEGYQIQGMGRIQAEGKAVMRLESLDRVLSDGEFDLGDPNEIDEED